ncbi:MAG: AsmA family protein [Gammaproteobacteria bacterium]
MKILLSVLAGALVLVLSAVFSLPFILDPNDYKPQMIAYVKDKTGRELEIPEDITLTFFPWLGVSTGRIILKNTPEFQNGPMVTIAQSDIKVRLIPLFSKTIQVKDIVLKGLNLTLVKNKQGQGNWDDLWPSDKVKTETPADVDTLPAKPRPAAPSAPLAALAINGIAIEGARIVWDDQAAGKYIELKDLNLKTDAFTFDHPVGIDLSFQVSGAGGMPANTIGLSTDLSISDTLNSVVLANLELNSSWSDVGSSGRRLAALLTAAELIYDRSEQGLKIAGLRLNCGELNIAAELSGSRLIDEPRIQGAVKVAPFDPSRFLQRLNIQLTKMRGPKAFGRLTSQFDLLATRESVEIQNFAGQLDDTRIKGSVLIKDFKRAAVNFEMNIDSIEADRYMPAQRKAEKAIATPAIALAAGLSQLPAETLKTLNLNGELSLERLKISGLTMQGLNFRVNASDGVVSTRQSIQRIYQGSYHGNLNLKQLNGQMELSLNERIERVHLEPLLKDWNGQAKIKGTVMASAQLRGRGRNTREIKSDLEGKMNFFLKETAVKGFNLQKIIDDVVSAHKGASPLGTVENEQTVFSEITGTAQLHRGILQNDDLVGKASKLKVEGKGSANLNDRGLDYKLITRLKKKPAQQSQPEQFHSTPIVVHIGGTFDRPNYSLDVSALLTERNKAKLEKLLGKKKDKIDRLLDKLDKKLGPGTGDLLKNMF